MDLKLSRVYVLVLLSRTGSERQPDSDPSNGGVNSDTMFKHEGQNEGKWKTENEEKIKNEKRKHWKNETKGKKLRKEKKKKEKALIRKIVEKGREKKIKKRRISKEREKEKRRKTRDWKKEKGEKLEKNKKDDNLKTEKRNRKTERGREKENKGDVGYLVEPGETVQFLITCCRKRNQSFQALNCVEGRSLLYFLGFLIQTRVLPVR